VRSRCRTSRSVHDLLAASTNAPPVARYSCEGHEACPCRSNGHKLRPFHSLELGPLEFGRPFLLLHPETPVKGALLPCVPKSPLFARIAIVEMALVGTSFCDSSLTDRFCKRPSLGGGRVGGSQWIPFASIISSPWTA